MLCNTTATSKQGLVQQPHQTQIYPLQHNRGRWACNASNCLRINLSNAACHKSNPTTTSQANAHSSTTSGAVDTETQHKCDATAVWRNNSSSRSTAYTRISYEPLETRAVDNIAVHAKVPAGPHAESTPQKRVGYSYCNWIYMQQAVLGCTSFMYSSFLQLVLNVRYRASINTK
jgi:hypothetical protein